MKTTFLAVDLSTHSFTSSVAPLAGAGYDRLLDYRADTYFRTSDATDQTLSVSLTAGTRDAVGIVGQNFDEISGSVVFEGSLTSGFDVSTSSLFTFSASSDPQVYTFDPTPFTYFRVRFSGLLGSPRLSQIYVGKAVSIDSYLPPFMVENIEAKTVDGLSLSGRTVATSQNDPRVRSEVRFAYLTDATRSAVAELVETARGRGRPLFFQNHEGVVRFVYFADDYSPVNIRGHNLNETQVLIMRTQGTSGLWNLQGPNSTGSAEGYTIGPIPDRKFVISVS